MVLNEKNMTLGDCCIASQWLWPMVTVSADLINLVWIDKVADNQ